MHWGIAWRTLDGRLGRELLRITENIDHSYRNHNSKTKSRARKNVDNAFNLSARPQPVATQRHSQCP